MKNQQTANIKRSTEAEILWESRREEIQRLYHQEGLSQAKLAEHYGVVQPAIFKVLKRLGIKAKSQGRKGQGNGRYVHGMASTLYRKMVKKDYCNACGSVENLCVHHKDGNHLNNKKANLEVLCSPCHTSHHKQEWWNSRKAGQPTISHAHRNQPRTDGLSDCDLRNIDAPESSGRSLSCTGAAGVVSD